MPLAFVQNRHSADLMSRVVTDANRLARLSSEVLVMAFRQVCTVVALLAVMFAQEPRLTLLALIAFPLVGLTIRAHRPPALPDQPPNAGEDRRR